MGVRINEYGFNDYTIEVGDIVGIYGDDNTIVYEKILRIDENNPNTKGYIPFITQTEDGLRKWRFPTDIVWESGSLDI